MMSAFTVVGYFLVSLLFGLIIFSLWLRIALRYLRISSLSQLNQLAYALTNPLLMPFITLFKYRYKPGQRYDWLAIVMLVCIEFLKIITLSFILFHQVIPTLYVLIYVLADLIIQPCNLLFYAVLIRVFLIYVKPEWQHPIADFLYLITQPLLRVGRKIIPDISGFDFSPFIVMIALKVITLFITATLPWSLL